MSCGHLGMLVRGPRATRQTNREHDGHRCVSVPGLRRRRSLRSRRRRSGLSGIFAVPVALGCLFTALRYDHWGMLVRHRAIYWVVSDTFTPGSRQRHHRTTVDFTAFCWGGVSSTNCALCPSTPPDEKGSITSLSVVLDAFGENVDTLFYIVCLR